MRTKPITRLERIANNTPSKERPKYSEILRTASPGPLRSPRSEVCPHRHPPHADDGAPGERPNNRAPTLDSATEILMQSRIPCAPITGICSHTAQSLRISCRTQTMDDVEPRKTPKGLVSRILQPVTRLSTWSNCLKPFNSCLQIQQMGLTGY